MKSFIFFTLIIINYCLSAQIYSSYEIYFDKDWEIERISFDVDNSKPNIWQIGIPGKSFLSEAYSSPNVIITDTMTPYPVNTHSSFTILHLARDGYEKTYDVGIFGYYKVDADSLRDYGLIEASFDNGDHWLNLLSDTLSIDYIQTSQPVLTGKSDWTEFSIFLFEGITSDVNLGDTVLYRFSFVSDSIPEERDGLMFDNLYFEDQSSGIGTQIINDFKVNTFPNPATDKISFTFKNVSFQPHTIQLYSSQGNLVHRIDDVRTNWIDVDVSNFEQGIYLYRIVNEVTQEQGGGKIIIE